MFDANAPQSILVIDDDHEIHMVVEIRLRAESLRIEHAFDAESAMAMAKAKRHDLFLLDHDLGNGRSGIELCRQFMEEPTLAGTPVIFLTDAVDVNTKVRAFDAGATDYVTKPFDAIELRARVRAALRAKRFQDLLATRARIDGLTGLWNRAYFDSRLEEDAALAARTGLPLSLVMLDIDHFKRINDTHGHPVGDTVLRRIAEVLLETLRRGDIACRYGGEEFAVILRDTDIGEAERAAERIRVAIERTELSNGTTRIPVTVSLGVASDALVAARAPLRAVDLLACADRALYVAKTGGRNRWIRGESRV